MPPDQKAAWVERVLGVVVPDPAQPVPSAARGGDAAQVQDEGNAPDEGGVRARLNEIGVALRNSRTMPGFHDLTQLLSDAVGLLRGGDLTGASAKLDLIETAVVENRSKARAGGDAAKGISLRAAASAGLAWRKLCAETGNRITELKDVVITAMIDDDDFDPSDIEQVRANLDRLDEVTQGLRDDIAEMMDDLINLSPEARVGQAAVIRKTLDEQEMFIASNEVLAAVDDNGLIDSDIAKRALASISTLRAALS